MGEWGGGLMSFSSHGSCLKNGYEKGWLSLVYMINEPEATWSPLGHQAVYINDRMGILKPG